MVSTRGKAQLSGAEPQLFVTDLESAFAHYRKLGFEVAFTYGEPPFYAQVKRDGVALNLRLTPELPFDPAMVAAEAMLSVTILTSDAKQLYEEFQASGVPFRQELKKEPWGAWTFIVNDPDGNLVMFAGSA